MLGRMRSISPPSLARFSSSPSSTALLLDAAALGKAAGLRSMTPVAALALRGRLPGPAALRWVALAAAAGELVGDKLPQTPPRTAPPVLAGRLAAGALAGALVAGPAGAAAGAATAVAAAYLGQHGRAALGRITGLPDPAIAVGEDALAIAIAAWAVRDLG